MKRFWMIFWLLAFLPAAVLAQSNVRVINQNNVTTTFTAFTLNGASQTLIAAQAAGASANSGFTVVNPTGNATVYIDISGGTASATRGIPVTAGTFLSIQGGVGPLNAVTVLGTNTQIIQLFVS